ATRLEWTYRPSSLAWPPTRAAGWRSTPTPTRRPNWPTSSLAPGWRAGPGLRPTACSIGCRLRTLKWSSTDGAHRHHDRGPRRAELVALAAPLPRCRASGLRLATPFGPSLVGVRPRRPPRARLLDFAGPGG